MKLKIVVTSIVLILIVVLLVLRVGNSSSLLPREDGIVGITVNSLPEGYHYSFSGDEVHIIIEYLASIDLISDFSENPNEYHGAVWVISIQYENGDVVTVHHMGNKFIKNNSGPWYKMNYDEANRFEYLLDELTEK